MLGIGPGRCANHCTKKVRHPGDGYIQQSSRFSNQNLGIASILPSLLPTTMSERESYLIVGGCGFLGRHIVEQLLAREETQVSVFDIVQRHFER